MIGDYCDDDDVKIAPQDLSKLFAKENPVADDNIDLLMCQRANGNTARARAMGKRFVEDLIDCVWTKAPEDVESGVFELQTKMLFAYAVHRVIADYSPNHIVANAALGSFYENLEDADEQLSQQINDNAAFSLYVLLHRSGNETPKTIGETFAKLCEAGECSDCSILGESAYSRFLGGCAQIMLNAGFIE